MKDTNFAQITGLIRVMEKKLVTTDTLNRAIEIDSPSETLKALSQSSEYDFSRISSPGEYALVLNDALKSLYNWAYENAEGNPIPDVTAAKYDYHNIKTALKAKLLGKDHKRLYIHVSATDPELIHAAVHGIELKDAPEAPAFVREAAITAESAFEASRDPQDIDTALDKDMFAHMLGLCEQMGNEFITGYVQLAIEFYNIKTLLRVKNMNRDIRFLSGSLAAGGLTDIGAVLRLYGSDVTDIIHEMIIKNPSFGYFGASCLKATNDSKESGNYSALEKLFDNHLLNYLRQTKYIAFGPEILFAYILNKENEIRQLRILMTCKINNIRKPVLRERLRDNYA